MKAADSAPSPSRFCSALGTRSAAVSASACGPTPKKKATVCSRARPDNRLSRMPAPTLAAPPRRPARPARPGSGGGGAAAAAAGLCSTSLSILPLAQPGHHQGDVVGLLDAALPVGEVRQDAVAHLAGGAAGRRPGDGAHQALLSVLLLVVVVHLDDAVGVDHQQVAGRDLGLVAEIGRAHV